MCFGGDFLLLEAEEHHAVEEFEAHLEFVGDGGRSVDFVLCAEFDDVGEDLVVHLAVVGELARLEELAMNVGETFDDILIDLKVSALRLAFFAEHGAKIGVPFFYFRGLLGGELELREITFAETVDIASVGTNDVFNLPHIEEELGAVFVLELLSNEHISRKR